jgi:PAS domain S-box-containing protein
LEGETADLVIIRDINDRKKIEERLHKSENLYRTLAEASNDLIFIIDRNDRVEYVNSFASKMVNKTPQQIIGQSRSSLFPPDVVEQQKKALKEVFDKGIPFRSEGALIFGDYIHWYDHYLKPLMDADNNVRAVLGISRDITERKNIEKKLLEGRELYQHLLEQSFDAIAIHKEGKIASVNEKAARILGAARPEDLEGKSIFEFIHPDSCKDLEDRLQKLTNDLGMIVPVIIEKFIRTDGSTVIVEVFATSFDDNGTPAFRVAFREITSQCIS